MENEVAIPDPVKRIRDDHHDLQRKRYHSDQPAAKKVRNERAKERGITKRGRLEFSYTEEETKTALFNKLDQVKLSLGNGNMFKVNTLTALTRVLDFYLAYNIQNEVDDDNVGMEQVNRALPEYQHIQEQDCLTERLFVCARSSLVKLVKDVTCHNRSCPHDMSMSDSPKQCEHVLMSSLTCEADHTIKWTSSPHVEGGKFLANMRMAHGYFTSGMLQVQYNKFCKEACLGTMGEKYLKKLQEQYSEVVMALAKDSQEDALLEETTAKVMQSEDGAVGGIDILTDARHCWRRNARFSDVVCLGNISHKAICVKTISKRDEVCSQKHEIVGTKQIYEHLDEQGCTVDKHAHDNNSSITAFVRDERPDTENAKETWHATKNIAKKAQKLTKGKQAFKYKTWHPELADKASSIKTHIYWAMKTCGGNPKVLRDNIDNAVEHYKNNHGKCHHTARCHTDAPNYEPSKCLITCPKAEKILLDFLHSLPMYKEAHYYKDCMNTHYVESYNNALLQYQDKRICFGEKTYSLRTNLAILDWNEHVDRPHTSEKEIEDARHPRRKVPIPVHSKKRYQFKKTLWDRWINSLYPN